MSDNSKAPEDFADFLKMEYRAARDEVEKSGGTLTEVDWVLKFLNKRLREFDRKDKFSVTTVNDWMNRKRLPDGQNFVRCIKVWGLKVLPFLGVPEQSWGDEDLVEVIQNWDQAGPTARKNARRIVTGKSELGELAFTEEAVR